MTTYYYKKPDASVQKTNEQAYLMAQIVFKDIVHEYADEHVVIFTRKKYIPRIRKLEKLEKKTKGWT